MNKVFSVLTSFLLSGFVSSTAYATSNPPEISSTAPNEAQVNLMYSYQVQASDPDGDALTYSFGYSLPGMNIDANGLVTWSPTLADAGKHYYKVVVVDETYLRTEQYIELNVIDPNNAAPVIHGVPNTETVVNTLYEFDLQALDPNDDALLYRVFSWPAVTGLSIDNNGVVTWTPTPDQVGEYWVWATADDQKFGETEISFSLRVTDPSNNNPVILNKSEANTINAGELYSYQVDAVDADGDALSYQISAWPSNSGISISASGLIEWTPRVDQVEAYYVILKVNDGRLGEDIHNYKLTVIDPNNQAPVIPGEPITSVNYDENYYFDTLTTDPDGDEISFGLMVWPEHPVGLSIDQSGVVTWQPTQDQVGSYGVTIVADDQRLGVTKLSYELRVEDASNTPPVIGNRSLHATINVGQNYTYDLEASDLDGDPLTYTLVMNPESPTASMSNDGIVEWTPALSDVGQHNVTVYVEDGRLGKDIHSFQINVVSSGNLPPSITSTPVTSVDVNSNYSYDVDATDPENDVLTYALTTSPIGMAIDSATGVITWLPDAAGDYSIDVSVSDGVNPAVLQSYTLTVNPPANTAPIANDQSITLNEDIVTSIALTASDAEGDALTFAVLTAPTQGVLTGTAPNVTYVPNSNATGSDSFTFQVNDGALDSNIATVGISILPVNDAPLADALSLSTNEDTPINVTLSGSDIENSPLTFIVDTQPTNGVLSGTLPNLVYTPNENVSGTDSFTYHVNDGELDSSSVTVSITINPINDAPVANAQSVNVDEDEEVNITLTGSDPDGGALTYVVDTQPNNGVLSGTLPNLVYTPNENFNGSDSFTYHVNDGELDSAIVSVSITVVSQNDTPSANPQSVSTNEDTTVDVSLTGSDPDGDVLTFAINTQPANGSLSGTAPNLTYTPNENFFGTDSFTFLVNDGQSDSFPASVSIAVSGINEAPTFVTTPLLSVNENEAYSYDSDAVDVDGDVLNYTANMSPPGSSVDAGLGVVSWQFGSEYVQSINAENKNCFLDPTDITEFEPALKWHWNGSPDHPTSNMVYGPILVGQLSDDNGDGQINDLDTPDLVFSARTPTSDTSSALHIVDGDTGESIFSDRMNITSIGSQSLADIDGDGIVEIIAGTRDRSQLIALEHTGELKWSMPHGPLFTRDNKGNRDAISVSDLDADGSPEIIVGKRVYSSEGVSLWEGSNDIGGQSQYGISSIVADVNLDGQKEVIAGRSLYSSTGETLYHQSSISSGGHNAVGNFDEDDFAEIVLNSNGRVYLLEHTGEIKWGPVNIPGRGYGGPPTVADFDGDGLPEIGVAGERSYMVVEHDGQVKWSVPVTDETSNRTGSSAFDFNGDGEVEVTYADEFDFYIFEGSTGETIWSTPKRSGTVLEYPVIADVDNDGHAEIVVGSNRSTDSAMNGVWVYEGVNDDWAPTRSIWNQHAYSISNINDDGTVPANEIPSWLTHNTYRLNTFPDYNALNQIDLRVGDIRIADAGTITADIQNIGLAPLNADLIVEFYDGDPEISGVLIGTGVVDDLSANTAISVSVSYDTQLLNGDLFVRANHEKNIEECQYDNNQSRAALFDLNVQDPEGLQDAQRYLVNVHNVNESPAITTTELTHAITDGDFFQFSITSSDTDLGDTLSYSLVNAPDGMNINSLTGEITWQPGTSDVGDVVVDVVVTDLSEAEHTVSLTFTVLRNELPIADSQSLSTPEEVSVDVTLAGSDPENKPITYSVASQPANGVLSGTEPNLVYTPNENFFGEDTFTYTVNDGAQDSLAAIVTINVAGINEAPIFVTSPLLTVNENETYNYDSDANDVDGDALTYSADISPSGSVTDASTGVVSWSGAADYVQSINAQNSQCFATTFDISGGIEHRVKWRWVGNGNDPSYSSVFGPVLVGQLTDDNDDGLINEADMPDLVFSSEIGEHPYDTHLNIVSGSDGQTLFSVDLDTTAVGTPALGDIDGDGIVEIVVNNRSRSLLMVFEHTGELKWQVPNSPEYTQEIRGNRDAIAIADLDLDGSPEIISGRRVYRADGQLWWEGTNDIAGQFNYGTIPLVADVNLDGFPEIVAGRSLYSNDGATLYHQSAISRDGYNAIGNFDEDDFAEIVLVANERVYLLEHTGEIVWGPRAVSGGGFGGPPTVADFDGDGEVEIGIAGANYYSVLETNGDLKWRVRTIDASSNRTGSSVFDFNGDGQVEVVYADEQNFYVFSGEDGTILLSIPNPSATTFEYPVVVDIDNDGSAEVVFGANEGDSGNGVTVIEGLEDNWVPTRSIWNQHAYSINNVNDDGTIPANPQPSWLEHNTFRLNTFIDKRPLVQADLRVGDIEISSLDIISARVQNLGLAPLNTEVTVEFYEGDPEGTGTLIGSQTIVNLPNGEETVVSIAYDTEVLADDVFVRVNNAENVTECQYENNQTRAALISLNVQDPDGLSDTQRYLVNVHNVNEDPQITTTETTHLMTEGDFFQFTVESTDSDLGDAVSYSLVNAPSGMHINEHTGVIAWQTGTSDIGEVTVDVVVTDLTGGSSAISFTFTVLENQRPVADSQSVSTNEDVALDITLGGLDPENETISFVLVSSPTNGSLTGTAPNLVYTPNENFFGADSFNFYVSDGVLSSELATVIISVSPINDAPVITSTPVAAANEAESYLYQVIAEDSDSIVQYQLANAPTGMAIEPVSGLITWDIDYYSAGVHQISVVVTDGELTATQNYDLVVSDVDVNLTIMSTPSHEADEGDLYTYGVDVAYDGAGTPIFESLGHHRSEIDPDTGEFMWTAPTTRYSQALNPYCEIPVENDNPYFDLRGWEAVYGASSTHGGTQTYSFSESGLAVNVDGNGAPLYLVSDFEVTEGVVQIDMRVENSSDNDYIGFSWGFTDPEHSFNLAWNQGAMLIRRFNSPEPLDDGSGINDHWYTAQPNLMWQMGVNYTAYLDIKPGVYKIYLYNADTGELIFTRSIHDDTYISGRIALFAFSQDGITYKARFVDRAPAADLVWGDLEYIDGDDATDQINGTIINRGAVDSVPTEAGVRFIEHDENGGYVSEFIVPSVRDIPALSPGESFDVTWSVDEIHSRYTRISGFVDADSSNYFNHMNVAECFETNNFRTVSLMNIRVNDQQGESDEQRWGIDTNAVNAPPVIDSTAPQYAVVGEAYQYGVLVVDPDEGDHLIGELIQGPTDASFDLGGSTLVWIPQISDLGRVVDTTIRFTDLEGLFVEENFSLTVHQKPEITSTPVYVARAGQLYHYDVDAIDNDGDSLTYSLTESPAGMSIDDATGLISWAPSAAGINVPVTVQVSDGRGGIAEQSYPLAVLNPGETNVVPSLAGNSPSANAQQRVEYMATFTVIDSDGNAPRYSLLEGPVGMVIGETDGVLRWTPPFTQVLTHPVSIRVHDQRGGFDTFSFVINIGSTGNSAPIISSAPPQDAEIDLLYSYPVIASDPDGDELNYQLTVAPWGMTISQTGLISWTPSTDQEGLRDVTVRVSDPSNGYAEQSFNIAVRGNSAPVITSSPITVTSVAADYRYQVTAMDAENDPLSFVLVTAPSGISIDEATGLIQWTPDAAQEGNHDVTVNVSDGRFTAEQNFVVSVSAQTFLPLTVTAEVSNASFDLGGSTLITVTTQNGLAGLNVSATLNGADLALDGAGQATVTPTAAGSYTVIATANDGRGPVSDTVTFQVSDPSDTTPPSVTIHTPTTDSTLTTANDIVATVTDDNLASYRVLYKRESEANWNTFATGSSNVVNSPVAVFDPSLLINGIYHIAIEATDVNGATDLDSTTVIVDGDLKVGNFSFTVRDLTVPLAGIPIEVNRTYDSRRRHESLDFGFGWSVDYQNVLIEESRTPGFGWEVVTTGTIIANVCVEPLGAPIVTVTLPNGDVERFEGSASPHCMVNTPSFDVALVFNSVGDTQSTLQPVNAGGARVINGNLQRLDESEPIDPDQYILTTRAGYIYHLNQNFGIESIEDPNGHTLTYSDSGIVHSSGKAVTFERDTDGQITAVIAPDGERLTYTRDTNGDLTSVVDRDTAQTQYTYNQNHGLVDIIDPLGRRITRNLYDDDGRLIGQEDADGNVKTFDHDLDARSSLITDLDGRSTLFNYDDRGNVTQESVLISDGNYAGDIVTTYTYDANDNQETKTIGGSTWTTLHNGNNDVLESRNPEGESVSYGSYNSRGQEGTITDERGQTYNMTYDAIGNLVSVASPEITDPDTGAVSSPSAGNVINAQGLVESTTDLRGMTTSYSYYPQGHPNEYQKQSESNPVSGTVTFTYDDNNNVASETRARTVNGSLVNETTSYTYDARDRVVRTTHHDGSYTETEYDLAGNTDRSRDRFGNWTNYTYDLYGRLTETLYADGSSDSRTYTAEGLLETSTDRAGRTTRNEYDDAGRLWRVHNESDNTFTETRYNENGWVVAEYDALRNLTEYEYDLAGRRTAVVRHIDGGTQRHTFTYYANGELQSETDALGHTTTYVLNELDQRIEVQYHNGTSMQERFDFMGTRTRSIDQENRSTAFSYDDLGRLTGVTPEVTIDGSPMPATTYTYDEVGNKLTQTDAEGRTTTWTYDVYGRVLSRQLPAGMTETFAYNDGQGCLPTDGIACAAATSPRTTVRTDFNGDTTTTAYDIMGRLIAMQYSKDGNSEVYSYYNNDQVHTVTDQHGTTTYTYDVRDRLATETKPDGTVMSYSYDDNGNRTSVSVTRNSIVTSSTSYTYDALNRLENVTDASGVTTYNYDAVGNLDTVTYPNGLQTDYDYNTINQLTDVYTRDPLNVAISHFNYTLTPTGRREVITELDGRTTTYTYDELYRLVAESITDSVNGDYSATYEYDLVGNREYETVDGVQTAYTYDFNDRLVQTGGTTYTYDDNGNTLTETLDGNVKAYTWDGKNKLTNLDDGTNTTGFTYNYRGIRTSKTTNAVTTSFIVDENTDYAQVLEEVESGSAVVTYSYGHDLLNQERAGTHSYYHYDGLGSTRALSDDLGSITDSYNYEAFGDVLNQAGSTENNYLFTGEQFDSSLNQYYLRARYYNQGVGRFTQMDTWMGRNFDPVTLHKYLYANIDPVLNVDPSGMFVGNIQAMRIQAGLATTATSVSAALRTIRLVSLAVAAYSLHGSSTRTDNCDPYDDECERSIPTIIYGGDKMPHIRQHIADALASGLTNILTYQNRAGESRPDWDAEQLTGCTTAAKEASGFNRPSCDEYPFFSTVQGGSANIRAGSVSLRYVPLGEQNSQGGTMSRFYSSCQLTTGVAVEKTYRVIVDPSKRTQYYGGMCPQNSPN